MSEFLKHVVDRLLESVPILLVLIGVILFLGGVAGGVQYQNLLTIDETPARVATSIAGVIVFTIGLIRLWSNPDDVLPKKNNYRIKIESPKNGDVVEQVHVRGTIAKGLPKGFVLQIIRIYPTEGFVPLGKAQLNPDGKTWEARDCNIGGKTQQRRELAICLVGPGAQAIFDYFGEANRVHNITLDKLRLAGSDDQFLPPIKIRPPDLIECDRVTLIRG